MIVPIMLLFLAAEPTPVSLQPTTKWNVDYGDTSCTAKRSFGAGADALTLVLRPMASDFKQITLSLMIPAVAKNVSSSGATLTLRPLDKSAPLRLFPPSDDWPLRSFGTTYLDFKSVSASLPDAKALEVRTGKQSRILATGDLNPILSALAKCGKSLLRGWGVDPSASTMAEPIGNPGEWVTDNDYPAAAYGRRAGGKVMLVATITPDGKTSGCRIIKTSGDRDLDLASCAAVYL